MYVLYDNQIIAFCKEKDVFKVKEYFKNKYGWFVDFFKEEEAWMVEDYSKQNELNQYLKGVLK